MILIFPWARDTTDGKPSPKNYPYWPQVIDQLKKQGDPRFPVQVSCSGEPDLACHSRVDDPSLSKIEKMLTECQTWISIDSFLPHMAWSIGKPGIVIFGPSDPAIFGHPENINLLRDKRYLRTRQFGLWSQEKPNPDAFVGPEAVITAVSLSLKRRNG